MSLKILLLVVVIIIPFISCEERSSSRRRWEPPKPFETIVHDAFCIRQQKIEENSHLERHCERLNANYLKFFFSLFAMIGWGAAVRTFLRVFKLSIPYTVVLMISGLIIGLGTRISEEVCQTWSMFTKIARTPPQIILYVFLPALIFESAFSMKSHIFMRSFLQVSIIALPGMLLTTFLTALGCQQFMIKYQWTFTQAVFFGAIISATDPVAVVAILRELGTSEQLGVLIEGESLLNDGVAILLYDIFKDIVEHPEDTEDLAAQITLQFLRITIGGPVFGYFSAKLAIFFLARIFNDAAVEITITLVAAYLTYFVGEYFLGVSGVMAVVILGITMSSESTSITPEIESLG